MLKGFTLLIGIIAVVGTAYRLKQIKEKKGTVLISIEDQLGGYGLIPKYITPTKVKVGSTESSLSTVQHERTVDVIDSSDQVRYHILVSDYREVNNTKDIFVSDSAASNIDWTVLQTVPASELIARIVSKDNVGYALVEIIYHNRIVLRETATLQRKDLL